MCGRLEVEERSRTYLNVYDDLIGNPLQTQILTDGKGWERDLSWAHLKKAEDSRRRATSGGREE